MPHRRQVVCVFECRFPNDEVPFVCEGARGVRRLCVGARAGPQRWRGAAAGAVASREPAGGAQEAPPRVLRAVHAQPHFELAFANACTVPNAACGVI